ncbi:MAG: RdgB/HAM1 family non-canonical purine NTP pyrophosphatase [Bacteroidota bacterium]
MEVRNLVFATSNPNKVREINQLLGGQDVKSLKDIGCTEEVPETTNTIKGNAIQKAEYVSTHYQIDCFAEDTGLEVDGLNGEPGVHTAYYAGPARDANANMAKVLKGLQGQPNRKARFRTVIALVQDGEVRTFEGVVEGQILESPRGEGGFGYDPIFQADGYEQSFAEMEPDKKNGISHRARAFRKLVTHLKIS